MCLFVHVRMFMFVWEWKPCATVTIQLFVPNVCLQCCQSSDGKSGWRRRTERWGEGEKERLWVTVSVESVCVHSLIWSQASGQMMSSTKVFCDQRWWGFGDEDFFFFLLGIANYYPTLPLHIVMLKTQFSAAVS